MNAPIIGITTSQDKRNIGDVNVVRSTYVRAVQKAGGIPVAVPLGLTEGELSDLIQSLDGLVFTGGGDIDPILFGGIPHPRVYGIQPERDHQEMSLIHKVVDQPLPFLAICRGIQVLNVALGGSLYTHIEDQLPNSLHHEHEDNFPYDHISHDVVLDTDSRLFTILGAPAVPVNSLHHQGLWKIGRDLRPVGHSCDGLVEAVEMTAHPFGIGVQWHPEWMPDILSMQALFVDFIQAARK